MGICTHNDGHTIKKLLDQCILISSKIKLSDLNLSIDKIIVVSSGSVDKTNQILKLSQQSKFGDNLIIPIIQNSRNGKSNAINKILNINKSEYLILISADVSITYNSIIRLIHKIVSDKTIGVVSGHPIPNTKNETSKLVQLVLNYIWKLHHITLNHLALTDIEQIQHSTGELMILKKCVIQKIPDYIINDDAFIAYKAKLNGFKVSYEPNAITKIQVPKNIKQYIIQRKRILVGHKQLKQRSNTNSSNFRMLSTHRFIAATRILQKSINSFEDVKGLFMSTLLEIHCETLIFIDKIMKFNIESKQVLWRRVNQTAD
jgi:cellulose synthase/poly-beta-1,6-N-acetylglucosamine synthase-like glycosyltransferase